MAGAWFSAPTGKHCRARPSRRVCAWLRSGSLTSGLPLSLQPQWPGPLVAECAPCVDGLHLVLPADGHLGSCWVWAAREAFPGRLVHSCGSPTRGWGWLGVGRCVCFMLRQRAASSKAGKNTFYQTTLTNLLHIFHPRVEQGLLRPSCLHRGCVTGVQHRHLIKTTLTLQTPGTDMTGLSAPTHPSGTQAPGRGPSG